MFPTPKLHPPPSLTVFGPHLSSPCPPPPPPPQCLLCANSCLVLFCCLCQAPWWTIDCSSGWVQPQQLSSSLSLSLSRSAVSVWLCFYSLSFSLMIEISPPEVSTFAFSPSLPHFHSLLCSLSFSHHPSSYLSITVAWCLLAWRLPTGATGGLRSSDLEQNLN